MRETLLDTDTLTEVLKRKDPRVAQNAAAYFAHHGRFTISAVTRFEMLRGLKEKGAAAQITRFQLFCTRSRILGPASTPRSASPPPTNSSSGACSR